MKQIQLQVNGELLYATVSARTQLAEVLRDHFHLTATHLGCEQGVCGACTVVVDGIPVRACITYAHASDGAEVTTLEGLRKDPLSAKLRDAFTRHHALQCGFCTPGMFITARDMILRGVARDPEQIRHELSGNLCRCTGYMGLVAAVSEVASTHPIVDSPPASARPATHKQSPIRRPAPEGSPFEGFDIDPRFVAAPVTLSASSISVDASDGWSSFARELHIAQPVHDVWHLFVDLKRVAECIPGVSLTRTDGDHFEGETAILFGPVTAIFDGRGSRRLDDINRTGSIIAHGTDPKGQAKLEVRFEFTLHEVEVGSAAAAAGHTNLDLGIRFRIQGHLAQFNRPELVESFADAILGQFARNCELSLAGKAVQSETGISGFGLLWKAFVVWCKTRLSRD